MEQWEYDEKFNKTIGIFLKEKRKLKGLARDKMAREIGISKNTATNIENKNSRCFFQDLFKISEVLDFNLNELAERLRGIK